MKRYLAFLILINFLFVPFLATGKISCNFAEEETCLDAKGCYWDEKTNCQPTKLNLEYPIFGGLKLNLNIKLNQLVAWIYAFLVGISGAVAFVMIVFGGFRYITSAGNPTAMSDAKSRIVSAFLGLLIILSSYLILKEINPEFVLLTVP